AQPLDAAATAHPAACTGVVGTDDRGQSWNLLTPDASSRHVDVSPSAADTAYLSTYNGVWKTTNGGNTWKVVTPGIASQLAVAPSDPATLYATLTSGMSKSVDGGETWSSIMSGLPIDYYEAFYGFEASAMAVDPSNASNVYLAKDSG